MGVKFTLTYGRKVLRAVLCLTVWVLDKLFPKLRLKVKAGGMSPEIGAKMFQVFPIMEQIHEMIAYAAEALSYELPQALSEKLNVQLNRVAEPDKTRC